MTLIAASNNSLDIQGLGQVSLPTSGIFDWVGGQDNNKNTGLHIGPNAVNAGDTIRISEASGRYSGEHVVKYKGADDGTYKDSMVTIGVPRVPGQVINGTWELVKPVATASAPAVVTQQAAQQNTVQYYDDEPVVKTSNTGPIVVASVLGLMGIGAFILLTRK